MWVYQCLDILSTVVEMACLYIISGILLKESRFHTSLCKYISPIIMFMVTWILTWFSGLGAFKMPIIFYRGFHSIASQLQRVHLPNCYCYRNLVYLLYFFSGGICLSSLEVYIQ